MANTREPVQVYHAPFARCCIMRKIEHDAHCDNCGGERAKGGAFRYGDQSDGLTARIHWQAHTFCGVQCMREYHCITREP